MLNLCMENFVAIDNFFLAGRYLLEVMSTKYVFSQMKIKISPTDQAVAAVEYTYPGAAFVSASYPLILQAHARVNYFEKKQDMNIISMITGNPMMLMMVFSFGIMMYMPKMMAGMDKEQLKELQAQQGDPMQGMKKLFGMTETKDKDDEDD